LDDFNKLTLALSTPERPARVTKVDPPKLQVETLAMSFRSSCLLPHSVANQCESVGQAPYTLLESIVPTDLVLDDSPRLFTIVSNKSFSFI
jgi:hypothetical protein